MSTSVAAPMPGIVDLRQSLGVRHPSDTSSPGREDRAHCFERSCECQAEPGAFGFAERKHTVARITESGRFVPGAHETSLRVMWRPQQIMTDFVRERAAERT